jgi:hypothetical protein
MFLARKTAHKNVWQKCIEVYGEVGQCRKAVLMVLALPIATKKQFRTLALPYTAWLQQKQRLAFP